MADAPVATGSGAPGPPPKPRSGSRSDKWADPVKAAQAKQRYAEAQARRVEQQETLKQQMCDFANSSDWIREMPEAPVYRPTAEEFADPMAYIQKIQVEAAKYGICKVVPPYVPAVPGGLVLAASSTSSSPFVRGFTFTARTQEVRSSKWRSWTGQDFYQNDKKYTIREYERQANDYASRKFGSCGLLPPLMVEAQYWRERETRAADKSEWVDYGNDVEGSAFSDGASADPLASSRWNFKQLAREPGSVLRQASQAVPGVTDPMLYIGMLYATFAWHVEDHYLYSINYMHLGAPKTWYGVPASDADGLERVAKENVYDQAIAADRAAGQWDEAECRALSALLGKTTVFSPALLMAAGVKVCRAVQHAGEFVITFPRAYHAGFSHGFNCGEAVNFCTGDWFPYGYDASLRYQRLKRTPIMPHEELLCREAVSVLAAQDCALLKRLMQHKEADVEQEAAAARAPLAAPTTAAPAPGSSGDATPPSASAEAAAAPDAAHAGSKEECSSISRWDAEQPSSTVTVLLSFVRFMRWQHAARAELAGAGLFESLPQADVNAELGSSVCSSCAAACHLCVVYSPRRLNKQGAQAALCLTCGCEQLLGDAAGAVGSSSGGGGSGGTVVCSRLLPTLEHLARFLEPLVAPCCVGAPQTSLGDEGLTEAARYGSPPHALCAHDLRTPHTWLPLLPPSVAVPTVWVRGHSQSSAVMAYARKAVTMAEMLGLPAVALADIDEEEGPDAEAADTEPLATAIKLPPLAMAKAALAPPAATAPAAAAAAAVPNAQKQKKDAATAATADAAAAAKLGEEGDNAHTSGSGGAKQEEMEDEQELERQEGDAAVQGAAQQEEGAATAMDVDGQPGAGKSRRQGMCKVDAESGGHDRAEAAQESQRAEGGKTDHGERRGSSGSGSGGGPEEDGSERSHVTTTLVAATPLTAGAPDTAPAVQKAAEGVGRSAARRDSATSGVNVRRCDPAPLVAAGPGASASVVPAPLARQEGVPPAEAGGRSAAAAAAAAAAESEPAERLGAVTTAAAQADAQLAPGGSGNGRRKRVMQLTDGAVSQPVPAAPAESAPVPAAATEAGSRRTTRHAAAAAATQGVAGQKATLSTRGSDAAGRFKSVNQDFTAQRLKTAKTGAVTDATAAAAANRAEANVAKADAAPAVLKSQRGPSSSSKAPAAGKRRLPVILELPTAGPADRHEAAAPGGKKRRKTSGDVAAAAAAASASAAQAAPETGSVPETVPVLLPYHRASSAAAAQASRPPPQPPAPSATPAALQPPAAGSAGRKAYETAVLVDASDVDVSLEAEVNAGLIRRTLRHVYRPATPPLRFLVPMCEVTGVLLPHKAQEVAWIELLKGLSRLALSAGLPHFLLPQVFDVTLPDGSGIAMPVPMLGAEDLSAIMTALSGEQLLAARLRRLVGHGLWEQHPILGTQPALSHRQLMDELASRRHLMTLQDCFADICRVVSDLRYVVLQQQLRHSRLPPAGGALAQQASAALQAFDQHMAQQGRRQALHHNPLPPHPQLPPSAALGGGGRGDPLASDRTPAQRAFAGGPMFGELPQLPLFSHVPSWVPSTGGASVGAATVAALRSSFGAAAGGGGGSLAADWPARSQSGAQQLQQQLLPDRVARLRQAPNLQLLPDAAPAAPHIGGYGARFDRSVVTGMPGGNSSFGGGGGGGKHFF